MTQTRATYYFLISSDLQKSFNIVHQWKTPHSSLLSLIFCVSVVKNGKR